MERSFYVILSMGRLADGNGILSRATFTTGDENMGIPVRLARAMGAGLALGVAATAATGCSSIRTAIQNANTDAAAYHDLQEYIKDTLTTRLNRPVSSVSCVPHVQQVLQEDSVTLKCVVVFTDGTWYTTRGTITDSSTDPDIATESFTFGYPPAADITTAPLPGPTVWLSATSPDSLLLARNLTPAVRKLTARFDSSNLILQLAIYPGELVAVIGSNGTAWPVSVTYSGAMTVGPAATFNGSRNGIGFPQFIPGVIQNLTGLITTKGEARLGNVSRFVLNNSLPGGRSGWDIYLTSGSVRYRALVLGDNPQIITPAGARDLK